MGRVSSGSSRSLISPKKTQQKQTVEKPQAQVQQINHTIQQPGFFSNMWQGFGLGAGQSIAMNIFRSPTQVHHINDTSTSTSTPSTSTPTIYEKCLKDGNNKESCTLYDQCMKKYDTSICEQHLMHD